MKRFALFLGLLITIILGYLAAVHFSGGAYPSFGLSLGGSRGELRAVSMRFMEDITYKDFESAASYHDPLIQEQVDIPYLIQKLFKVKPEAMNFIDHEVLFAKLDSSQLRARVKMRVKVEFLGNKQIRDQELMLYFERENLKAPWYMKLEDSLRRVSAQKGKKN